MKLLGSPQSKIQELRARLPRHCGQIGPNLVHENLAREPGENGTARRAIAAFADGRQSLHDPYDGSANATEPLALPHMDLHFSRGQHRCVKAQTCGAKTGVTCSRITRSDTGMPIFHEYLIAFV